MYEIMLFLHVKGYTFWKFDQSSTHWDEIQILQFLWDKGKVTEMHSFFFHELQLIAVSLLIRYCYMSWSTRFIPLKLCVVFSIFDSAFISLYFCSTKSIDSLTLQRPNFFQIKNNRKVTYNFAPRPLIFKL